MLDLENVGVAVGISFLSDLEADLELVPFRRSPSWVFHFRFRPALVPLVPLTCRRVAAEIVYLASIEAKIHWFMSRILLNIAISGFAVTILDYWKMMD